jgi:hypothetical protein
VLQVFLVDGNRPSTELHKFNDDGGFWSSGLKFCFGRRSLPVLCPRHWDCQRLWAHGDDARKLSWQDVDGAANIGHDTIKCKVVRIDDLEVNAIRFIT